MGRENSVYWALLLAGLPMIIHADIIEVPDRCIELYKEHNAVPRTQQCKIRAGNSSTNMRTWQCTANPEWVGAYCNSLPNYSTEDDGVTTYGRADDSAADEGLPGYDDPLDNQPSCSGIAQGEYIPTIPQPIDTYLGMTSTGYSLYSATVSTFNLAESSRQAELTGDSSELFDNVYSMLWSAVLPLGDVIGMDDIFRDVSQLADDLASGGAC